MSLPHPPAPPEADAFVLAGGRSSRMGQEKALVHLSGKPLIHHALQILRDAGLEPCIAGAQADFSAGSPTLMDDPSAPGQGPLSGICTALASGTRDLAVFIPVDLPFLPSCLIAWLIHHAALTQAAVTLVSVSAFVQTFPAVIRREALPQLLASLRSDDRNCLRAFREASRTLSQLFSVMPLEFLLQSRQISHPHSFPSAFWFLNINSPGDLTRAESLLPKTNFK